MTNDARENAAIDAVREVLDKILGLSGDDAEYGYALLLVRAKDGIVENVVVSTDLATPEFCTLCESAKVAAAALYPPEKTMGGTAH